MEILAGVALTLLIIVCISTIVTLNKLSSVSTTMSKLDTDSEAIKLAVQNVNAQLTVVLEEINDVGNMDMGMPMIGHMDADPGQRKIFKSLDGRYTANTFEELIEKMRKDVDYKEIQDMMGGEDDEEEDKPWENGSNK